MDYVFENKQTNKHANKQNEMNVIVIVTPLTRGFYLFS